MIPFRAFGVPYFEGSPKIKSRKQAKKTAKALVRLIGPSRGLIRLLRRLVRPLEGLLRPSKALKGLVRHLRGLIRSLSAGP